MLPKFLEIAGGTESDPFTLAIRLLLAWLCGWLIALVARYRQPTDAPDTQTLTLVLLSILISIATQIIGDNVARAFSLVGALSIVRFRTAVPTTREVAFVLAAVVVGMAIGAGQYLVAALGIVVVGFATHVCSVFSRPHGSNVVAEVAQPAWRLTLTVGLHAGENGWEAVLQDKTRLSQNIGVEVVKRGAAIELIYRLQLAPTVTPAELVATLNRVAGVEAVVLKQA